MPEADTQEHYVAAPCCNVAATFDQDFGFLERIENFAVEQLISAVSRDGIGDIQPSVHESTERSLIV